MIRVDVSAAAYTYDTDGYRVRKDAGGDATEYIYFGGQVIAEFKPTAGDWSDYIYANGSRIAQANSFQNSIHTSGQYCSSCDWQWSIFQFGNIGALAGKPASGFAAEPSGNLDSRSSAELLGFMQRAVRDLGQTIVMVTHDPEIAAYANRVIHFMDGHIEADVHNGHSSDRASEIIKAIPQSDTGAQVPAEGD